MKIETIESLTRKDASRYEHANLKVEADLFRKRLMVDLPGRKMPELLDGWSIEVRNDGASLVIEERLPSGTIVPHRLIL